MDFFLKLIAFVLVILSLLSCFTACETDKDQSDGEIKTEFDISEYTIVRPVSASDDLITAVGTFKNNIAKSAKVTLPISDDWYEDDEDVECKKEILIGDTNRSASVNAKSELDAKNNSKAYLIKEVDNKIVIVGKSDAVLVRAIKQFVNSFVKTSSKEGTIALEENFSAFGKADTSTIMFDNFVELRISDKYDIYSSATDYSNSTTNTYPKLVQLKYQANEANNGIILATLNSNDPFYRIMKSEDDGNTWTQIATVYDSYNSNDPKGENLQAGRMPILYELPVDMGAYKKGTIFLAGTSSPVGGEYANYEKTAITLYASTDLGETWTDLPSIDYGEGKINGNGIWEPFLIYEEETKRLYCFYSDATGEHTDPINPQPDQKLVYKYTTDLKTWIGKDGKIGQTDDPFEAVACADVKLRPGMISIAKMGNGEYIMTYEMGRISGNPTYAKRTTRLDDWGDVTDYGEEVLSTEGRSFGSSPWVAWSPVGGECGTLVVMGQHWAQDKTDKTAPSLFFSFDYGETYIEVKNPIGYTIDANNENRSGYSPCLMFSADGKTLYYATNPNKKVFPNRAYIAMVRIEIIE